MRHVVGGRPEMGRPPRCPRPGRVADPGCRGHGVPDAVRRPGAVPRVIGRCRRAVARSGPGAVARAGAPRRPSRCLQHVDRARTGTGVRRGRANRLPPNASAMDVSPAVYRACWPQWGTHRRGAGWGKRRRVLGASLDRSTGAAGAAARPAHAGADACSGRGPRATSCCSYAAGRLRVPVPARAAMRLPRVVGGGRVGDVGSPAAARPARPRQGASRSGDGSVAPPGRDRGSGDGECGEGRFSAGSGGVRRGARRWAQRSPPAGTGSGTARGRCSRMRNSTRRFFSRPSGVSFDAMGSVSPKPLAISRSGATPRATR